MHFFRKKTIFLDHAAGRDNPSAIHEEGQRARQNLEEARTRVARLLHAGSKDVIFTSGGTESDNLAILGTFEKARESITRPHIIVTEYDHPAILEAAREVERRGAELSIVPAGDIISHIKDSTVLISVSLCNSETGELLPIGRIGRRVREIRKSRNSEYPYLHADASQAVLTQHLNIDTLQADLLTLDGGKMGAKGAGVLVVRPWVHIRPEQLGGGQERGIRSGTENVAAITSFAQALTLTDAEREVFAAKCAELRTAFIDLLQRDIPQVVINGGAEVVSNIVSVTIPGKLHEFLAIKLAEQGVMVSAGSACGSGKDEEDKQALRFSFGRETTERELESVARILKRILLQ